ncbi:tumor necrosis factor receptor superfamily member 5-like isoform X2 [Erpetoichthys calabaricus]|uniref:tumor necrosis factor receptor superfamily member 5-like isoform X2 n=1 Tax=Erpetoichthys calabaricus TaxID=27687 RepID=UPI00109FDD6B|nr:tumor necrosis factor receptor superfamily member 5-like isoform X2 [Erpetoichthys calabaricus]
MDFIFKTQLQISLGLLALLSVIFGQEKMHPCSSETENCEEAEPNNKVNRCRLCPPGTFVYKHCNDTVDRECHTCPQGTYTSVYNNVTQCLRCSRCNAGLVVAVNCSVHSNTVCDCAEGKICRGNSCSSCRDHQQCPRGTFISKPGTNKTEPECSPIPDQFKNDSDICLNQTSCIQKRGNTSKCIKQPDSTCITTTKASGLFVGLEVWVTFLILPIVILIVFTCILWWWKRASNVKDGGGHTGSESEQSSLSSNLPLLRNCEGLSPSSSHHSTYQTNLSSANQSPISVCNTPLEFESKTTQSNCQNPDLQAGGCQHSVISGMTVHGNVYIYNGPVVNNNCSSSLASSSENGSPETGLPARLSEIRLPIQEERTSVPVQEQPNQPQQEFGKESHLSIVENTVY